MGRLAILFAILLLVLGCGGTVAVLTTAIGSGSSSSMGSNNQPPIVTVSELGLFTNTDESRGIPIPFTVLDPDDDEVEVLFQWRLASKDNYPRLAVNDGPSLLEGPSSDLRSFLRDADFDALQICTEIRATFTGRIQAVPNDAQAVRLPELASSASGLVERDDEGKPRVQGKLEILRGFRDLRRISQFWAGEGTGLRNPVGVAVDEVGVEERGGLEVVVLEKVGPRWRLRRVRLDTGEDLGTLSEGHGTPTALTVESPGSSILFAISMGGSRWELRRAEFDDLPGDSEFLFASNDDDGSGGELLVRGIASLGLGSAIVTVQSSLIRVVYAMDEERARSNPLFSALDEPWGVVNVPRSSTAYVAEFGADRIIEVDLETGMLREVSTENLRQPAAMVFEPSGNRLLIAANDEKGDREVMAVELGEGVEYSILGNEIRKEPVVGVLGGLATGPEGLTIACLATEDDFLVGGGIEQRRSLKSLPMDYDPQRQTVRVDSPFFPKLIGGNPWRVRTSSTLVSARSTPVKHVFTWDSRDVGQAGDVFLRAIAFDRSSIGEPGDTAESSVPKHVGLGFGFEAQFVKGTEGSLVDGSVAVADLNRDGRPDLVIPDSGDARNRLLIRFQDRGGDFSISSSEVILAAGADPVFVLAEDVDEDGFMDLVTANAGDGTLSIAYQSEDGTFDTVQSVGGNGMTDMPMSVAVADFDRDGRRDLVSANSESSTVTIFLQTGSRTFDLAKTLGGIMETPEPQAVVALDIDRDGRIDIVSVNRGVDDFPNSVPGFLTVFLQELEGDLEFSSTDLALEGLLPRPVAVSGGDLDGDGDIDLIAADSGRGQLQVYLQEKAGTFKSAPIGLGDLDTSAVFRALTLVDFNRDGFLDVLSTDQRQNRIVLFRGRAIEPFLLGEGMGAPPPTPVFLSDATTTPGPLSIASLDLDGDGRVDILTANSGSSEKLGTMLLQTSVGFSESNPTVLRDDSVIDRPRSVATGDFDGDGDLDVVSANDNSDNLSVFFQINPRLFLPTPEILGSPELFRDPISVLAVDLDGDARVDLVSTNSGSNSLAIFLQKKDNDSELFESPLILGDDTTSGEEAELTGGPRDVAAEDLDGNGFLDLVSANPNTDNLTVFWQGSSGFEVEPTVLEDGDLFFPTSVVTADVNGDGNLDVVAAYRGRNRSGKGVGIFLRARSSPREFESARTFLKGEPSDIDQVKIVLVEDLDGDGDLDILVGSQDGALRVLLREAEGDLDFQLESVDCGCFMDPESLSLTDVDGDGDLDIVGADGRQRNVTVLLQGPPGVFDRRPPRTMMFAPRFLSSTDIDGDGDVDLLLATQENSVLILYGDR